MQLDKELLSSLTVFMKYSKYIPELSRRETWEELIERNMDMHIKRFPNLEQEIREVYNRSVFPKKILPAMRSLQFAGLPMEVNNCRMFNCSYQPMDDYRAFSEGMFLLLSGCGYGYSVQKHHVDKLPEIKRPIKSRRYVIGDSIHGWADAVKVLISSYMNGKSKPLFDFRDIRPKGAKLITSGGKAPGPEPLKRCLFEIEQILERKENGDKLTPIELHSIMCHIADAVLAGGIRRSAMICLFSFDDEEMLSCKSGNWWELNPHFARANNSVVVVSSRITKQEFNELWDKIKASGAGEPGIYFTNDPEYGTNPCVVGETELITKKGYERIDTLVDREVEIWNGFEWSKVTPKITGNNQPIIKITLSDGRELTSTNYHNWYLAEGYTGKNKKVQTKDLKIGDKIIKYNFPIIKEGDKITNKHAYTQGFISAEGMDDYKYFWIYEPKYVCKERLDIRIEGSEFKNVNGVGRKIIYYNDIYESKDFIPFSWCLVSKMEWLSGLFDGDGTELIEGGLQLCSTNYNFLKDLQKLLSTLGVNSKIVNAQEEGNRIMPDGKGGEKEYFCKKSFRICIGAIQMQELKDLGLLCQRLKFDKTPQRDASQFVKVVKIEDMGYADTVYCFNEPIRHYGVFNGILTGQCVETSLRSHTFCNLVEINGDNIENQEDFNTRAKDAAFINTLQASYTDFYYLRDIWKKNTEKDALIGVGITGIGSGSLDNLDKEEASSIVKKENERIAKIIGINKAARTTVVKPAGTTSLVLGTSSGIHAYHDNFYIRRVRVGKNESIYQYLGIYHPELLEDELFRPHDTAVISIPQKAPEIAHLRSESAISLLERTREYNIKWVRKGHRSGPNYHNVSATISIKDNEWEEVGQWMWENKDTYHGLSILPFSDHSYKQAPFESCTEEEYNKLFKNLHTIDLTKVVEFNDNVSYSDSIACTGGACEII